MPTASKPSRTTAKSEETRRRIIRAAATVVGRHGYANASVARIVARARLAQGTFYYYFASRDALFDELLPTIGQELLDYIRARTTPSGTEIERERERLLAAFAFYRERPELYRILTEAETFAPKAFRAHIDLLLQGYVRALGRARDRGELAAFGPDELPALAYILMAARTYLMLGFATHRKGKVDIPDQLAETFAKLLGHGLR